MSLPTGTVTFLFTDIEGSTKLWEAYPEQMSFALARHDAIMREAIARNEGHVFKTVGDAFCAAFPTAPSGLNACLEAQLSLGEEPWPEPVKIKVRMAIHTGPAESRDADYFGQTLNRVARLLASGHGGQTLVSRACVDQANGSLAPPARLISLGEHRLRDIGVAEAIFQLGHPNLRADFPPLRSLESVPNNLPQQVTSFIGRENELSEIRSLLEKTRLLTLLGTGGAGKTRLSLQIASEMVEGSWDGVWFMELAPLTDPDLVISTVAGLLGLREGSGATTLETLTDYIKDKRLVLILDNCEHLVEACAQLADGVLRRCPRAVILASSREALGTEGELCYQVPSLSHPDVVGTATLESISGFEAVRLFIERAKFHATNFAVTDRNAPALASICQRLDGIPLAIELSAARVRSLSVEEIDGRLDQRFRLLTGGSRTALPRQQTLRSLIDWSYELLNDSEKRLLARLSVFSGGWGVTAAERVTADGDSQIGSVEVLDVLQSLVDKSLVIAGTRGALARFRMLETVRHYAMDRLEESGERETIRANHRNYFLEFAEEAEPYLRGSEQAHFLAVLDAEHDNLRAALSFSQEEPGGAEPGLRLARSLWVFWANRGYMREGREQLSQLLALVSNAARSELWVDAVNGMATLAFLQSDHDDAFSHYEEAREAAQEIGYKKGLAASLNGLGNVAVESAQYDAARAMYTESVALQRELGNTLGLTAALVNLGRVAYMQGDYEASRIQQEECLAIYRREGDQNGIAKSLYHLGVVAFYEGNHALSIALGEESLAVRRELGHTQGIADSLNLIASAASEMGDYAKARPIHEEGLALQRELGNKPGIGASLINLGALAQREGDEASARSLYAESLTVLRELGDKRGIAESLDGMASMAYLAGQGERSAQLWGAASAARDSVGSVLSPTQEEAREAEIAVARESVGMEAFSAAWEAGRRMTLDQAIDSAFAE